MKTMISMKKRIFLLFLSIMMLCMANVPLYAAAVIPDGIIVEENLGGEDELMPMGATGCNVPGIGYVGTKAWRNCVSTVAQGGTILDFNGTIVTESVATMMIVEA